MTHAHTTTENIFISTTLFIRNNPKSTLAPTPTPDRHPSSRASPASHHDNIPDQRRQPVYGLWVCALAVQSHGQRLGLQQTEAAVPEQGRWLAAL